LRTYLLYAFYIRENLKTAHILAGTYTYCGICNCAAQISLPLPMPRQAISYHSVSDRYSEQGKDYETEPRTAHCSRLY